MVVHAVSARPAARTRAARSGVLRTFISIQSDFCFEKPSTRAALVGRTRIVVVGRRVRGDGAAIAQRRRGGGVGRGVVLLAVAAERRVASRVHGERAAVQKLTGGVHVGLAARDVRHGCRIVVVDRVRHRRRDMDGRRIADTVHTDGSTVVIVAGIGLRAAGGSEWTPHGDILRSSRLRHASQNDGGRAKRGNQI